jgi:hypothetical protein
VYCIGLAQLQDVKWLQSITSMPILVKGVVTAEDGTLSFVILLISFVLTLNEHEYVIHTDAGEPSKPRSEAGGPLRRGGHHRVEPRRASAGLRAGHHQRPRGGSFFFPFFQPLIT